MRLPTSSPNCCCSSATIRLDSEAGAWGTTSRDWSSASCASKSDDFFCASRSMARNASSCCWWSWSESSFPLAAFSEALLRDSSFPLAASSAALRRDSSSLSLSLSCWTVDCHSMAICSASSSLAFSATSARCLSPATASSSLATFSSVPELCSDSTASMRETRSCSSSESFACFSTMPSSLASIRCVCSSSCSLCWRRLLASASCASRSAMRARPSASSAITELYGMTASPRESCLQATVSMPFDTTEFWAPIAPAQEKSICRSGSLNSKVR
mmetsp:Transcript_116471/g.340751  ORF Transcript_116471/g.340751 Transcript_116471/m.340751 type:complete len:273 (+) Transcript_116471:1250-2068(+)